MTRNRKKAKKIQENVPASAQQCPEPENVSMTSVPVNNSMSDRELERFHEVASGVNKNKENVIASSEMSSKSTDELIKKPEPPESNPEVLSQLKNTCRALKSELNATKKKLEDEKQQKQKLYEENQDLKSKVSTLERELQDSKMQIQRFEKESAHHQKSSEECERMEDEPTKDNAWEKREQKASVDSTWEEKEDGWTQNNAQGTCEKSWSDAEQDTEMTDSFNRGQSGLFKGNHQYKDGNYYKADRKQLDRTAASWHAGSEAGSSSQPSNRSSVPAASGSDTKWQKERGSVMGQQRNEWRQSQPPNRYAEQPTARNQEQHRGLRNWGRGRGFDNRGDRGQNDRRGREDWGDRGQNCNLIENNRDRYEDRMRPTGEPSVVTEIVGDLFDAPTDWSLAHCVAEDMRMGSGIAVTFRQKFKRVEELLQQRKRQGDVAVLEDEGRYIYYLVTKRESNGKPTMETLERSLMAMHDHVVQNKVEKIAMPRIGCGLDRLDWHKVKPLIKDIFSKSGAQITIYNYNEDMAESSKPKTTSNVWFKTAEKPVADIERETAILCLCAADGSVDSTLELLDRKFRIMSQYQNMDRKLGNILHISKQDYLIFLLIVREGKSSPLSFLALGKCMKEACKLIDKLKYCYVAVESFDDTNEPFLFERVITVIKNYLDTKWKKELWLCCPKNI